MATAASKTVDKDALAILRTITFDGNVAVLNCGQLERPRYEAVNKVLTALGGKWHKAKKGHVFDDDDARDQLEAVIETGRYVNAKQLFGFFETPRDLASKVAELAQIEPGMSLLEPSAGKGSLVREARQRSADPIHAVETNRKYTADIRAAGARFIHVADFLTLTPDALGQFDRVLMNPPFARQADVLHVNHAKQFVKPGGILVAIMSSSWTFRSGSLAQQFRALVERRGTWKHNPPGAFKASGTGVQTTTVVLRRPTDAELAAEQGVSKETAEDGKEQQDASGGPGAPAGDSGEAPQTKSGA